MDLANWRKAATALPRLERAEWDRLDIVAKWLVSARAPVLVMTLIPCLVVGLLAIRAGRFEAGLWLSLTAGLLLAHATNNLLNDLIDFRLGVDRGDYFRTRYGVQPVASGFLSMRQSLGLAAATGLAALAFGACLVQARGGATLALLLVGAGFVVFYTWPLKHIGLGEIAVFLVWGPLMVAGGYYVVTGLWDGAVAAASLPCGLGAASVIFGKHIDKCEADRAKGIRLLPVLLGERISRHVAMAMMIAQYVVVAGLVASGAFGPALLVVGAALPALMSALAVFARPRPAAAPAGFPAAAWPLWFAAYSFAHNRIFGLCFLVGLGADTVLHRLAL